jgi:hypothetical protein
MANGDLYSLNDILPLLMQRPGNDVSNAPGATHWPEEPNPAQPYLDATKRFVHGGFSEALGWQPNALSSALKGQAAQDALSMMPGLGMARGVRAIPPLTAAQAEKSLTAGLKGYATDWGNPTLTEAQIGTIGDHIKSGLSNAQIATKYNTTPAAIQYQRQKLGLSRTGAEYRGQKYGEERTPTPPAPVQTSGPSLPQLKSLQDKGPDISPQEMALYLKTFGM